MLKFAFSFSGKKGILKTVVKEDHMMELQDVMEKRRSIRKYQKKEVAKELIEQIIEAAILAPTWKNSQTGRYHVITSQEMLEKVKWEGLARFNGENVEDAPVLIVETFVKNRSGFEKTGEPSNELGNGWGCYDLGLQTMNLLLKATELGLGTLVMGIRSEERLREIVSIPPEETIVSVIAVGYADIDPLKPKRKIASDIITYH